MPPSARDRLFFRLLAGLWLIILLSATAFIASTRLPVFDDSNHLIDVMRYSEFGVSLETLKQHANPPGPFAYIWIALIGNLLGGELWSFRLVNALSALVVGVLLLRLRRRDQARALACVLAVNPYLPLASATILTEVPSLLVFTAGSLFWLQGLAETPVERGARAAWRPTAMVLIGSALLGLAIIGRQYYLAALPAMAVTLLMMRPQYPSGQVRSRMVVALTSTALAALPVVGLFAVWGGLTSPSMQQGLSYDNLTARIGINFLRPITSGMYLGIYALPVLALQRGIDWNVCRKLGLLAAGIAAVIAVAVPQDYLWCPTETANGCGPIGILYRIVAAHGTDWALIYNLVLAFAGCAGLLLLIRAVWTDYPAGVWAPEGIFGFAFLVFFLGEQVFVGGNIPFYERYTLQIAPAIGLALAHSRQFSVDRALVGSVPFIVLGQFRLWRNF